MGSWTLIPYKTLKGTLAGVRKGTFKGIVYIYIYIYILFGYMGPLVG